MKRNIPNFLTIAFILFQATLFAQNKSNVYYKSNLIELNKDFNSNFLHKKKLIQNASQKYNWPIHIIKENGKRFTAVDVNKDGSPIYTTTHSIDALESTRTDYLHSNGGLNLNLEGDDMIIGIWDGGLVYKSHNEFQDGVFSTQTRVIHGETSQFQNDAHGTHVAGIMISQGVDPNAIGMAPKATLHSYDWTNDRGEVSSEIINGNLLISNHSYGVPVFNNSGGFSQDETLPGKYTSEARSWDNLHYSSPYYLMVVSAGNEGSQSYPQSSAPNRDKLTHEKNSKNNLVVANAQDAAINNNGELLNVQINSSSSQGPSDDGRIKPDITGNGTGVYSTSPNSPNSYITQGGTSMSSPNVAGSLLLLQEHYNNLYGEFMRSATLKGIACHTADDAGVNGPDEVFGWGLLNSKKAAEIISANNKPTDDQKQAIIKELTLNQGQSYTINVKASGGKPLKASITWTDVAGNTNTQGLNDTTPALINDLDIRVSNNNETFLPWKINLFNIIGDAIKGDNAVDNVERVDIDSPTALNTYTITVTHKGTLQTGSQDFSLIITGLDGALSNEEYAQNQLSVWPNPVQNSVNFTSPNGFVDAEVTIYDLNGRMVKKFENITSNKTFSADLSGVQTGVYIANLTDSNGLNIQKRIIKK